MWDEAARELARHRHQWQEFKPDKRVAMAPLRFCDRPSCDAIQVHDGQQWRTSPIKKTNIAIQIEVKQ